MGWSCDAAANNVLDRVSDACYAQTGTMNVWTANGKRYMFETTRRTHDDYRITGSIWRFLPSGHIARAGSFCIKSGTDYRFPASLRDLAGL